MKSLIINSFTVLLVLFSATGCKEILKENPESFLGIDNFFTSEKDFQLGIVGLYAQLNDNTMYGFDMFILGELGCDTYTTNSPDPSFEDLDRYTLTSAYNKAASFWQASYSAIARANFFIAGIEQSKAGSQTLKDTYKSEARFLRALHYFNLVRFYGDVPISLVPETSLNTTFTRSPSLDVYNVIIADLESAVADLPANAPQPGRATKGAAMSLLAKVYITMAGSPLNMGKPMYEKALVLLDDVIARSEAGTFKYSLLANYPSIFSERNENNAEIVFDAQAIAGPQEGVRAGKWGGYGGPSNNFSQGSFDTPRAIPSFTRSYKGGDTIRLRWNILDTMLNASGKYLKRTNINTYTAAKFRPDVNSFSINGNYVGFQTPQNVPIIRYSDVLLMQAEAENAVNGPTEKAYAALNKVRARVKAPLFTEQSVFADLYPTYQAEALSLNLADPATRFQEAIFWERAWELCFEGHRRFDLVRWNRLVSTVKNVVRPNEVATNTATTVNLRIFSYESVKDFHSLLPIPQKERSVQQNNFTQNTGY